MTSQHSIIEHRANYFFLKMEEDYLAIFFETDRHAHCKAAILSILEHWMNAKRTENSCEDDLYVYLSYPQFVKRMFGLYGRSTVIKSLDELVRAGLILRRPYTDQFNQDTFEYRLNIPVVQARLQSLPDVPVRGSLKVNGGSLKTNDPSLKTDGGSFENKPGGSPDLNGGSFKSKRNVDTTIDTNLDTPQISKEIVATSAEDRNAPAADNLIDFEERKTASGKMKAVSSSHSQCLSEEETVKMPAIPKQTPAAGTRALATDPPVGIQDDSTSAQASRDGTYSTPAQRSGASLAGIPASPGAVQASVKRKGKAVTQAPAPAIAPDVMAVIERWSEAMRKPHPLTDSLMKAATLLAPCNPTVQDLKDVRGFCFKSNPKWFRDERKGAVTLMDIAKNWEAWQSSLETSAGHSSSEQERDPDYSDFDIYKGNGKEERAAMLELYEEMVRDGRIDIAI